MDELRKAKRDLDELQDLDVEWSDFLKNYWGGTEWTSTVTYRAWGKRLKREFDMHDNGYWSDILEPSVAIKIQRKDGTSKMLNFLGIGQLAKILKPHEDGFVWFGIFEHTLSANGVYCLKVKPDLTERDLKRFSSLLHAVDYIANHHWYGDYADENPDE
jgi:hypothetical protein